MTVRNKWITGAAVVVAAGVIAALGIPPRRFAAILHRARGARRDQRCRGCDRHRERRDHRAGRIAGLGHDREAQRRFQFARCTTGDVIALIDPALLQGAVLQASADLASAQANVAAAEANVEKATAAQVQTKAAYDRLVVLERQGFDTKENVEVGTLQRGRGLGIRLGGARGGDAGERAGGPEAGRAHDREGEPRLHRDPLADRRRGARAERGRGPDRRGVAAGAHDLLDRAGSHEDARVCEDR